MLKRSTNMADTNEAAQEQEGCKNCKELTEQEIIPYVPELYELADQVDETATDNPNPGKFIEA